MPWNTVCLGAMIVLASTPSFAGEGDLTEMDRPRPVVSLGTSAGGGALFYHAYGGSPLPIIVVVDAQIGVWITDHVVLELWAPIGSMIVASVLSEGAALWGDLFARIYPLAAGRGVYIAPGVGGLTFTRAGESWAEVPVKLGYTWLFGRRLAVSVVGRPWLSVQVEQPPHIGYSLCNGCAPIVQQNGPHLYPSGGFLLSVDFEWRFGR